MKNQRKAVEIDLEGDTLKMLREAAKKNKCTLREATQYLIDFVDGSICDWSNAGFPMRATI